MRRRILLIDDSAFFLEALRDVLADEFVVETASSGEQAVDLLGASGSDDEEGVHFDLIITDLLMPGLNGYEVAQFVKSRNRANRFTPVIMLTGEDITKEDARKYGCAAYVPKSNLNKLVSMCRILLLR